MAHGLTDPFGVRLQEEADPAGGAGLVHDFIDSSRDSDIWGQFESMMRNKPSY